ncbi:MAG: VWA domain-containing protein [Candidatus Hydrothermarchaeota archaeon]
MNIYLGNELWLSLLVPLAILYYYLLHRSEKTFLGNKRFIILFLRFLVLALIVLSIVGVYSFETSTVEKPTLYILLDKSKSMMLYNANNQTNNLYSFFGEEIGKENVKLISFSPEYRTSIGKAIQDAALKMEGGKILLISDGQNNYGKDPIEASMIARERGISIYALGITKYRSDVAITDLILPEKSYPGSPIAIKSKIKNFGNLTAEYDFKLFIDDRLVYNVHKVQKKESEIIEYTYKTNDEGFHTIKAVIEPKNDYFPDNNVRYASLEIVERPKIIYISSDSSNYIINEIKNDYILTKASSTSIDDLNKYDAVILDNIPLNRISYSMISELRDYVREGRGLLVIGGDKSFDYGSYYKSSLEKILPVTSSPEPKRREERLGIVFVLDISGSTGQAFGGASKLDLEKAIAINLINDLNPRDFVGVIAFDVDPYVIKDFSPITDMGDLTEKISRLSSGEGTYITPALIKANNLLSGYSGKKYIVLISDGLTAFPEEAIQYAETSGTPIYTIGVGSDTYEPFMQALARKTGGEYFRPTAYQRLSFFLGKKEEEKKERYSLQILDEEHFITKDIEISSSVSGFNLVSKKPGAQSLIATDDMNMILTVWHYGLGRVAAYTTDNGNSWGYPFITWKDHPKLMKNIINWIIGDLEYRKPIKIISRNSELGENIILNIMTSFPMKNVELYERSENKALKLEQIDLNLYQYSFRPNHTGFFLFKVYGDKMNSDEEGVSVNYPEEIKELNPDTETLKKICSITGGKYYDFKEINSLKKDLLREIEETKQFETKVENLWEVLVKAALFLFFFEILLRRFLEYRYA